MHDVIIIGAGISGLGAARVLTRESHDVLVLEGRSRPGGRIHAVRMPYGETNSNDFGSMPNHDHLSVFHTGNSETTRNESSTKLATSESEDSLSSETTSSASCVKSPDAATKLNGSSNHVDVDLGANYLIGCSNRQNDQPLFHMAKLLNVPTAACVGDLCKKYRGWECAELAVWRNHKAPGAPIIPLTVVAEAAFLFDRVVHLTVQKHVELRKKLDKLTNNTNKDFELYGDDEPTVKEFFESALESILRSEAKFGLRPSATFRDDVEASIFDSIVARYLAYVNPLDRLPHTVLDELCEVATPRWHLSLDEPTLQSLGLLPTVPVRKLSLSDRLALLYPTVEQREAYQVWAERKLQALATGQCGSSPSVARAVNVSWEDRLVTGRFSDMLSPLMENVTIVYNAVVKAVHWDGRAGEAPITVRVCFPSDDGCEKEMLYHAKHCIITVPVGVLKGLHPRSAITFHPELPQRKREAIERLGPPYRGAPTHEKVILRFRVPDDIFWDVNAAHLKCPDARLHILNLHHYGKPGILCAHIWGGSGLCPAGQSDKAVVDVLLNLLDQMYPEAQYPRDGKLGVPEPVSYIVTRWCEDPFALGAYTTGEPGSSDADRLAYAASLTDEDGDCLSTDTKSMPRLLFAGEGTLTASEAKECTHGALLTGVARALDLLPYLNNNKSTESDSTDNQCDDQVLARSLESTRSLILGKLAHYLIGRPHLSWSANLNCQRSDRKNRRISTRPTPYSPMSKSSNGERKDFSLKSELRRTMVRRHTKLEEGSPVRSNLFGGNDGRRRVAGRGHSTAARNSALSRNSKRTDQVWKRVVRRKQQSRCDSLEPSAETQSETSSTTIEARISGSSSGSPEPRNQTILTRVMSGLQELSASWHLFPSLDRQRFLTDLVGLVDELHSRHLLLDTPQPSTVRTSSPMGDADSLHLVPPENPMAQFPFPF